jgi:hypothetical protein
MHTKGVHRFAVASIGATGLVGIIAGTVSLSGFQSPSSGDLASSSAGSGLIPAIVLVGTMALRSLQLVHIASLRPRRATATLAAGQRPLRSGQP